MPTAIILIIAGSDSGGGAGIQADIKTVTSLGGFACTAITALTAQNTKGVQDVLPIPPAFVRAQMKAVAEDIRVDCIKTGMLHNRAVIEEIAAGLEEYFPHCKLVLDPVMVSTSGHALLEADAVEALKKQLFPRAALLTPNLHEARLLTGEVLQTLEQIEACALALSAEYGCAVLIKGGHSDKTDTISDILALPGVSKARHFSHARQATTNTHGTGCTLASAIATFMAKGASLETATEQAINYVQEAIQQAPGDVGEGSGPLWHLV